MKEKPLVLLLSSFFSLLSFSAYSQKIYGFADLKVPLIEYIGSAINGTKENDNSKTDGVLFDLGAGFKLKGSLYLEGGIEYWAANKFRKNYYTNFADTKAPFDEVSITNSAFSFQLRPLLSIPLNEEASTRFRLGPAMRFQQLFSDASFYHHPNWTDPSVSEGTDKSRSDFSLGIQPQAGFQFRINDKLGVMFNLEYMKVDWSKAMSRLNPAGSNQVPAHKTSNVFFSAGFIF